MALCTYPELLKTDLFPNDAKERAEKFLNACPGKSVGSYTDGLGLALVREQISKFLFKRDNIPACSEDIFITAGASDGIKLIIEMLLFNPNEKPAGFMIPIPQFPFYSATISEFNAVQIGYYLDEENNWALNIDELDRAYQESLPKCRPRAICIINPGNPTGQVLTLENIQEIIKWAWKKKLFILADEVYQDNIYSEKNKFYSFKKVAIELSVPYSNIEIVSFYSVSKGFIGECGARAGFFEVINMDPLVKRELVKVSSIVCSSVIGQACLYALVDPPKPGELSYDIFIKEKQQVLDVLDQKAKLLTEMLNKIEGVKCNPVQGAMYAFARINIPKKAIDYARQIGKEADLFYCIEMINETGICVVPGSGFHQKDGTYHFRTTILPPIDEIKSFLIRFEKFHLDFVKKWS